MKTRDLIEADKLRGGFYTPEPLVDLCIARVSELIGSQTSLRVLEPSAGDGAFLRGLGRSHLRSQVSSIVAIELVEAVAAQCELALHAEQLTGTVINQSAIAWSATSAQEYDVAFGNPPFVRFQFIPDADREASGLLAKRLGTSFKGVSNLWIPVLLGALSCVRVGGAFAFVVPAECFTGIASGVVRRWLVEHSSDLQIDLFPPGSFPSVLQEVCIISGRRESSRSSAVKCTLTEHRAGGINESTHHLITPQTSSWTKYLLNEEQLSAYEYARSLSSVQEMGHLCSFEVAAVTGANSFFSVDEDTLVNHSMQRWSRPLLPRTRHAPGLVYTGEDHDRARASGARVHLLDFSSELDDPMTFEGASGYLSSGAELGIADRYKCRIRTPWYRVPGIRPGQLLMSKRSHEHPRVIFNGFGSVTTDTIYRGTVQPHCGLSGADITTSFHNSLSLLSAELEGRSFGGGVLELVPSEVARLAVPVIPGAGRRLAQLDEISRSSDGSRQLIAETDKLIAGMVSDFPLDLLSVLADARLSLLRRRLDRSSRPS